jgi:hypothetical protein
MQWLTEAYDKKERREWWGWALEIAVVALISWEIYIRGVRAARDFDNFKAQQAQQKKNFDDQQLVLKNMQTSSKATADTLILLQSTTQAMSDSLQKELALFYDVSLLPNYDKATDKVQFSNTGRTKLILYSFNCGPFSGQGFGEGREVASGTMYSIHIPVFMSTCLTNSR